ncbi:MAG: glutaredoxin domain-containing protein [Actinomycetaceae bacterium]
MRRGVVVYSVPECVRCTLTVRALRRGGVSVEVVRLDERPEAREVIEAMDFTAAPVVATPATWWQGMEPELIRATVRRYGLGCAEVGASNG